MITVLQAICFLALVWGSTNIVAGSKLLYPVRLRIAKTSEFLGELSDCYMCIGFWIAALLAGFSPTLGVCHNMDVLYWTPPVVDHVVGSIFDGFIGSGFVWIVYVILEKLGAGDR